MTIETQWRTEFYSPDAKKRSRSGFVYFYKKRRVWGAFQKSAGLEIKVGEFQTEEQAKEYLASIGVESRFVKQQPRKKTGSPELLRYEPDHEKICAKMKSIKKPLKLLLLENNIYSSTYYKWTKNKLAPHKFFGILAKELGGEPLDYAKVEKCTT
jgi:hypothetical protein